MSNWHYKGYGRIYVSKTEDITKVEDILKDIDNDEWECYAPQNIVGVWTGEHNLVYTHKFEPKLEDLAKRCLEEGIPVWWYSQYEEEL